VNAVLAMDVENQGTDPSEERDKLKRDGEYSVN
jgi:hypothetical protein